MQMIKRIFKEEKGLTLIELLAVIVILGIIAAIAVPAIGGLINSTGKKANDATARQIYEAARLYITSEQEGNFSGEVSLQKLINGKYFDKEPQVTNDNGTKETLVQADTKVIFTKIDDFSVILVGDKGFTKTYTEAEILK